MRSTTFDDISASEERSRLRDAFRAIDPTGRLSDECWRDYQVKLGAWQRCACGAWQVEWAAICAELLRRVWPAEMMRGILQTVGLPEGFEALDPPVSRAQARQAFLSAHWIRRRFTLGDLLYFAGWDREALWAEAAGEVLAAGT